MDQPMVTGSGKQTSDVDNSYLNSNRSLTYRLSDKWRPPSIGG